MVVGPGRLEGRLVNWWGFFGQVVDDDMLKEGRTNEVDLNNPPSTTSGQNKVPRRDQKTAWAFGGLPLTVQLLTLISHSSCY